MSQQGSNIGIIILVALLISFIIVVIVYFATKKTSKDENIEQTRIPSNKSNTASNPTDTASNQTDTNTSPVKETISSDTTPLPSLNVSGNSTLDGDLTVKGNSTLTKEVTFGDGWITKGNVVMNDKQIRLRGSGDSNHRIDYNKDIDGANIVGYAGGILASRENGKDKTILRWDSRGIKPSSWGFGPYKIYFYEKQRCLDAGQFEGNLRGSTNCQEKNANQHWYYHPVTGVLRNAAKGQCLNSENSKITFSPADSKCDTQWHRYVPFKGGLYNAADDYCLSGDDTDRRSASCNDSDSKLIFENDFN